MNQTMQYRGYDGSVQYSAEDKVLHGKLLGIRDMITYEGTSVTTLERNFKAAVDEYMEDCERDGREPNQPYKGSFNVRIPVDLHQRAARYAEEQGVALNTVVNHALTNLLSSRKPSAKVKKLISAA